ncbi:MAG: PaaI family thioesterase [Acidimicrobiia bacterium]
MTSHNPPDGAPWVQPHLDAPLSEEIAAFASPARIALTQSARQLIDALLTTEGASDADIEAARVVLERAVAKLSGKTTYSVGVRTRNERSYSDYVPRSPVIGSVHPVAPPLTYDWDAERRSLVATGTLPAAFEGPPGYAHGGMLAMLFDEIIGMGNIAAGYPGMTASLTVHYRRPTPIHRPLTFTALVDHVDGNTIEASGTCYAGDVMTARAQGRFVIVTQERAEQYFGTERAPFPQTSRDTPVD